MYEVIKMDKFIKGKTTQAVYNVPLYKNSLCASQIPDSLLPYFKDECEIQGYFGLWVWFNKYGTIEGQYAFKNYAFDSEIFDANLENADQHIFRVGASEDLKDPGILIKLSDDFQCLAKLNGDVVEEHRCDLVDFYSINY
jgi:hypothetical protein